MGAAICDASPLIFLAKLDLLELIDEVLGKRIVILRCIADEVCRGSVDEGEIVRLRHFFEDTDITEFSEADYPSQSLSESDRCVLNWAIQHRPDFLVADERLLRRIAREEGIATVGTFGILIETARRNLRTVAEVRASVDDLVSVHGCRISVALYRKIMAELEEIGR